MMNSLSGFYRTSIIYFGAELKSRYTCIGTEVASVKGAGTCDVGAASRKTSSSPECAKITFSYNCANRIQTYAQF